MSGLRFGAASDRGRSRIRNEDSYWCSPPWFVVADGMGGHIGGDLASRLAVEAVMGVARSQPAPSGSGDAGAAEEAVRLAMKAANRAVWEKGRASGGRGMGTTLTTVLILPERAVIGHVGDSRAYLFRRRSLSLLTVDHSVAGELVRSGTLTRAEAERHPHRHVLTRAVGLAPDVEHDLIETDWRPDDAMLLCSDGLSAVLGDAEIAAALGGAADPQAAVERLIAQANDRGGPDNITAVLVLGSEFQVRPVRGGTR